MDNDGKTLGTDSWRRSGQYQLHAVPCGVTPQTDEKKRKSLSEYFLKMGSFDSVELEDKGAKELGPIPSGEISGAISPLEMAPVDLTLFKSMEHLHKWLN